MKGKLNWIMEGIDQPLAASEGDIIYAPPNRFHAPEFAGEDLAQLQLKEVGLVPCC